MNERLDPPEPTESVYDVEVIILVKGIRAVDSGEACRLAVANIRDGLVIDADAYIEEPETDPDER